jgi:hypothetical protein
MREKRREDALGGAATIWCITSPEPHNRRHTTSRSIVDDPDLKKEGLTMTILVIDLQRLQRPPGAGGLVAE